LRVIPALSSCLLGVLAAFGCDDSRASETLFLENCAVCHQRDGMGIPDVYPSLVRSEVVRGSAVDVALVLLIGRGEMPSFKGVLSSDDMASIINYVRTTFGKQSDTISPERIAALQRAN